jgi:hypothetical protein
MNKSTIPPPALSGSGFAGRGLLPSSQPVYGLPVVLVFLFYFSAEPSSTGVRVENVR